MRKWISTTPCRIWAGARTKAVDGYGVRNIDGHMVTVHRLAFMEAVGDPGPGVHVDHLCNIKLCYEVTHLEAVAPAENTRRAWERALRCRHGHARTDENTVLRSNGTRRCRECVVVSWRRQDATRRGLRWQSQ